MSRSMELLVAQRELKDHTETCWTCAEGSACHKRREIKRKIQRLQYLVEQEKQP